PDGSATRSSRSTPHQAGWSSIFMSIPPGPRRFPSGGLLVCGYGCPATRHRWPTCSPYGARDGDLLGCQEVGGTDHTVVLSGWWGVGATPLRRRRPQSTTRSRQENARRLPANRDLGKEPANSGGDGDHGHDDGHSGQIIAAAAAVRALRALRHRAPPACAVSAPADPVTWRMTTRHRRQLPWLR